MTEFENVFKKALTAAEQEIADKELQKKIEEENERKEVGQALEKLQASVFPILERRAESFWTEDEGAKFLLNMARGYAKTIEERNKTENKGRLSFVYFFYLPNTEFNKSERQKVLTYNKGCGEWSPRWNPLYALKEIEGASCKPEDLLIGAHINYYCRDQILGDNWLNFSLSYLGGKVALEDGFTKNINMDVNSETHRELSNLFVQSLLERKYHQCASSARDHPW